jgi:hypothetical protein
MHMIDFSPPDRLRRAEEQPQLWTSSFAWCYSLRLGMYLCRVRSLLPRISRRSGGDSVVIPAMPRHGPVCHSFCIQLSLIASGFRASITGPCVETPSRFGCYSRDVALCHIQLSLIASGFRASITGLGRHSIFRIERVFSVRFWLRTACDFFSSFPTLAGKQGRGTTTMDKPFFLVPRISVSECIAGCFVSTRVRSCVPNSRDSPFGRFSFIYFFERDYVNSASLAVVPKSKLSGRYFGKKWSCIVRV